MFSPFEIESHYILTSLLGKEDHRPAIGMVVTVTSGESAEYVIVEDKQGG